MVSFTFTFALLFSILTHCCEQLVDNLELPELRVRAV